MLEVTANAKINLALDILYKRADGYHEVAMVMQAIALADTVYLTVSDKLTVVTDCSDLAGDRNNLAYRAAALLQDTFQITQGVAIQLNKKIPLAAGLAGGSADAAAVLRGLNQLWKLNLSLPELAKLGATLGSDVPFCLYGGTMLATGRGEVLHALPDLPERPVVLVKPKLSVSTAWVYQHYRAAAVTRHPDIQMMLGCLEQADLDGVAKTAGNVLESVTITAYPAISAIKQQLHALGAPLVLMSGSGPTVFALCRDERQAAAIAAAMAEFTAAQIIVTKTVAKAVRNNDPTVIAN